MKRKTSFYLLITLTIVFLAYCTYVVLLLATRRAGKNTSSEKEVNTEMNLTPTQPSDHFAISNGDGLNSGNKNGENDGLVIEVPEPETEDENTDKNDTNVMLPEDNKVEGDVSEDEKVDESDVTPPSDNEDVTTPDGNDTTTPDGEDATTPDDKDVTTPDDEDVTTPDIDDESEWNTNADLFTVEEIYKNSMADGSGKMLWNLNVSYSELNASDLLAQHGLYIVFKSNFSADGENSTQWYSFAHSFYNDEGDNYNSTGYLNGYVYSIQFAVVNIAPDDLELGGYSDDLLTKANFVALSNIYINQYFAL